MDATQQKQLIDIHSIWLSFGVRAKELLTTMTKVDLENFDVRQFEYEQIAAQTAIAKLEADIKEHLRNYPD